MAVAVAGKKKNRRQAFVPEWLVTFADLMSILVVFFVLIISFSIQDERKLQVVAGSMRDAFGVVQTFSNSAVMERDGNPERQFQRMLTHEINPAESQFATEDHDRFSNQGPRANTYDDERNDIETPKLFSLAAASVQQAWRENPDITTIADQLIVEETEEGLDILLVDQEGRPMFPEGSKFPYEATRAAIAAIAPVIQRLPNQIQVSGHTAAGNHYTDPRYGAWELSFDRANAARQILEEFGLSSSRIKAVVGRAETEPYFANDPYLSANQRVKITILNEEPPVPITWEP